MQKRFMLGLLLSVLSIVLSIETFALPPDPNAPATIESVDNAKKDIIETLVSLITGLAATASDLIYMTTPSSVVAMNTNAALQTAGTGIHDALTAASTNSTKYTLTGYMGFLDPPVDPSTISSLTPTPFLNSGLLVVDIYNALDSQMVGDTPDLNSNNQITHSTAYNNARTIFNQFMAIKKPCVEGKGTNCEGLAQAELQTKQKILETILGATDPITSSYIAGDAYYNPETLFSTSYASNNDVMASKVFIQQLEQLAAVPTPQPPGIPEPLSDTELQNIRDQNTADENKTPSTIDLIQIQRQGYTQAVLQLIAAKNLLMSNIHLIQAKRMPKPDISQQNLTDPSNSNKPVTSPLELESYAANRRLTPAYYQEMASASPTAVARETLFLLAEIRQQLFQNQLMSERLLAAISVAGLGSIANKSADLATTAKAIDGQIKMLINGTTKQATDLSEHPEDPLSTVTGNQTN